MGRDDSSGGWWQRNWCSCVGCGCLVVLLVIAAIAFGTWRMAGEWFESNGAITAAIARLNDDPRATGALGRPIEAVLWRDNTSFNFSGKGRMRARFSVSGPNGDGSVELEAHETDGSWQIDRLLLILDDQVEPIDLLESDQSHSSDPRSSPVRLRADATIAPCPTTTCNARTRAARRPSASIAS